MPDVRRAGSPGGTGPTTTANPAAAKQQVQANRTTDRRQKSAATHVIVPNPIVLHIAAAAVAG